MDPRLFLQFAKTLAAEASSSPAHYRTSISRSYYAAFHVALTFLRDHAKLAPMGGGDKHANVKLGFIECKDLDAKKIGIKLDILHTQRKDADYELAKAKSESQATALAVGQQAEALVNELDSLSQSAVKLTAIIGDIKAWATSPHGRTRLRNV